MTKLIKIVSFLAFFLISQQAFADCWKNAEQMPRGTPPVFLVNGMWCTTQQGANVQTTTQLVTVQSPTIIHTMPVGHVYRECTTEESVRRAALIAGGGGLVGLLIRDNGRAAGKGAGLGLLYALGTDCKVAIPQGTQQTIAIQGVSAGSSQGQSRLEKTTTASEDARDTCRLRQNGKVLAEIKLPTSVSHDQSEEICNDWQKREAKSRGLI